MNRQQMELERLEIQQYGKVQTSADAQPPDKLNDVDYVGSIDTWEIRGNMRVGQNSIIVLILV